MRKDCALNLKTVHSFTNTGAGSNSASGAAYTEKADQRSWETIKFFSDEIF